MGDNDNNDNNDNNNNNNYRIERRRVVAKATRRLKIFYFDLRLLSLSHNGFYNTRTP